jgi:hypothetical protein
MWIARRLAVSAMLAVLAAWPFFLPVAMGRTAAVTIVRRLLSLPVILGRPAIVRRRRA